MRTPRRRRAGLLSEPGRGFCQYLPFFTQHPVLPAQPIEFLPFGRGQTIAAQTLIEFCLPDPLADRLDRGLEFARQCRDAAAAVRQLDDSTPVFRCICWMRSGHWVLLLPFSPTPSTRTGQLHSDAVAAYRAALQEYTQTRVPLDWAMTQNNLG